MAGPKATSTSCTNLSYCAAPILGAAGPDGFYLDCGHSGTGFKTAPAVGRCMTELILDGQAKTVDISSYAPGRFAAGRLVKGNYDNIWK